jgi:hypothetical protein
MQTRRRILPEGWYPGSAEGVRQEVDAFESYIRSFTVELDEVRGGIVPHAGWYFSGRLAALVMHFIARKRNPDVVAVIGGHLGGGNGIVYPDDAWETPMGPLKVDQDLTEALAREAPLEKAAGGTNDNTVEVQLPLVAYYFPNAALVALRGPHSSQAIEIGEALARLADERGKTLAVIGSTDLTHYGPNYGFMPQGTGPDALKWVTEVNDKGFIDQALNLDPQGMLEHARENQSACSAGGAAAAVAAAKRMGAAKAELLDYYTTHNIMPGSSFVGYAGIVF